MFGGPEGIVIIVLLLLLFGGSQIPKLAKNLGQAQKELRSAMDDNDKDVSTDSNTGNDDKDGSTSS